MNPRFRTLLLLCIATVVAAGCATAPAPDPAGRWRPVNRFGDAPQAIPLRPAYVYYAAPLDRTLKGLLERWAADSRMTLDYRHAEDFTLYSRVADVRSYDLRVAVGQLAAAYAAQQVAIAVEGDRIVVAPASSGVAAPAGAAAGGAR